jgi:uncharacterized membrane protein YhaH (DUF805 family)
MAMINALKDFFTNIAITNGVANRSQFWWIILLVLISSVMQIYQQIVYITIIYTILSLLIIYYSIIYIKKSQDKINKKLLWIIVFIFSFCHIYAEYYFVNDPFYITYNFNNSIFKFLYIFIDCFASGFVSIGFITLFTRRLHDIGRSGLLQLWFYIPILIVTTFSLIIRGDFSLLFSNKIYLITLLVATLFLFLGIVYILLFLCVRPSKKINNKYLTQQ